ncbi:MAG: hypothetical protein IJ893_02805 [Bacteroidales bacterium]|nr:hypothetical protein [Bacteroidales bacterium]
MKKTVNENMTPDTETAEKAVATPKKAIADEAFEVRPSETVSIIAGDRVLFLGDGLKEIRITR